MITKTKVGEKLYWKSFFRKGVVKVTRINSSNSIQGNIIKDGKVTNTGTFLFRYLSIIE